MGKSIGKTKQSSNTNSSFAPWEPTQPLLKDLISRTGQASATGLSGDQTAAFTALKGNALHGDPFTAQKAGHADFLFSQAGPGGEVAQAYDTAKGALTPYAQGEYLDPRSNPQMQALLDDTSDDVYNRINAAFAGAGREITGNAAGQQAVAKGITQAQLPILFDQFNRQQSLQQSAAGQLQQQAQSGVDARALYGARAGEQGNTALDAYNYGAERLIDLDQKIKGLPYEDLGKVAALLFPGAGLGGTSQAQSRGKASSSQFKLF